MEEKLGCLGIWESPEDYVLCNGDSELLPKLHKKDEIRFEYNQYANKWSYVSCTIFAAVWMASDQTNYQFSYDEIKEIDDMSYTRWRIRGQGWYVQSAVKLVADWWNDNKKLTEKYWKVAYYRISKYDDEVIESVIDKLYTLDTNYQGNKKYWEDKKDWVLDGTDFWPATYGHSVDIISNNWKRSVKDSWSTNQVYELKHPVSQIKCYGSFLYLYTKVAEDALEEIKRLNELKTKIVQVIELNSAIWNLINDATYKNSLHKMNEDNRNKLKTVEELLTKYM